MSKYSKDSTTALKVVSAILFVIFVFSYIHGYQRGLLAAIQYAWSDGKTNYNNDIGASVLTVTALLISFVSMFFTQKMPPRIFCLNYLPSLVLLGLLLAVDVNGVVVSTSLTWLIVSPLLIILYFFIVNTASRMSSFLVPLRSRGLLSHVWWTNLMILALLFMLVFCMGNNDRTLHTRLNVELACKQKQWDEALQTGYPKYDNDSSLTMLRAFALASTQNLGEKLFTYEMTGGSQALFPKPDHSVQFMMSDGYKLWTTIGKVPRDLSVPVIDILEREVKKDMEDTLTVDSGYHIHRLRPVARDYLLCAYLLDKRLKDFGEKLPLFYTIDSKLPQHYKEALVLYNKVYPQLSIDSLKDDAIVADFADFQKLVRENRSPLMRENAMRDNFFGTYWYYYYRKGTSRSDVKK